MQNALINPINEIDVFYSYLAGRNIDEGMEECYSLFLATYEELSDELAQQALPVCESESIKTLAKELVTETLLVMFVLKSQNFLDDDCWKNYRMFCMKINVFFTLICGARHAFPKESNNKSEENQGIFFELDDEFADSLVDDLIPEDELDGLNRR